MSELKHSSMYETYYCLVHIRSSALDFEEYITNAIYKQCKQNANNVTYK